MSSFFGIELDASLGLPVFFLIGLYVALSPCLFPIMPLTVFRVMAKTQIVNGEETYSINKRDSIEWVVLLCLGIFTSFAVFALLANLIAGFLLQNHELLSFIFGIILLTVGTIILFPKFEEKTFARIPIPEKVTNFFNKEEFTRYDLFLLGAAFSIIAIPCSSPAFLVILNIIVATRNPLFTLVGMTLFGIGLFIPYLILVLLTSEARDRFIKGIKERFRLLEITTSILIILMGILFILPILGGPNIFV